MLFRGRPSLPLLLCLFLLLPFPYPAHGRGRLDNSQRPPAPKRRVYIRKSPSTTRGPELYSRCDASVKRLRSAVLLKEDEVLALEKETIFLGKLAANTVRKGLHCLSLQLTIQYYNNHLQQQIRTTDLAILENNQFYHYVIYSENVLAAATVVNSTAMNAKEPHKHVFHILTNGLNYAAIQMWFRAYPPDRSTVEVRNLDSAMHVLGALHAHTMREQLENNLIKLRRPGVPQQYLPDIFPNLDKVFLLHDDVIIMKDLSFLWDSEFGSRILGFSNPCNSTDDDGIRCSCVNIVNLQEWRNQGVSELNDTINYDHSLNQSDTTNVKDMPLEDVVHVFNVDTSNVGNIKDAAVIHYGGHGKPWSELGMGRYRSFWNHYVDYGNPILQQCNIHN